MTCPICRAEPQPAGYADPRRCAFHGQEEFTPDNWSCGTMSLLRQLTTVRPNEGRVLHHDDESLLFLKIPEGMSGLLEVLQCGVYKRRGRTSWANILNIENGETRPLTFTDAKYILSKVQFPFGSRTLIASLELEESLTVRHLMLLGTPLYWLSAS